MESGSKKVLVVLGVFGLVSGLIFLGFMALASSGILYEFGIGTGPPPEGVKTFGNLSRKHVEGEVSYEHIPPVGGDHWEVWQNCEFYEEPVRNETAVHSMERGAVWITYRPDLPQEQLEELKKYDRTDHVLVSSYPGLPAPVVASAWGKQLRLDLAKDPRLEQFVEAFFIGPQIPEEPPVTCGGGTSATVSESVEEKR
jgi:hypothetical protein